MAKGIPTTLSTILDKQSTKILCHHSVVVTKKSKKKKKKHQGNRPNHWTLGLIILTERPSYRLIMQVFLLLMQSLYEKLNENLEALKNT